nr:NADP-dependent phosphogluconate dehydrogenase [Candidatus Gracilibacteria bacterium]
MEKSKIGLIGLAVMGENLARNIANNGYKISVYNRTTEKTKEFIEKGYSKNLIGTYSIKDFVESLESPKKIIIMVKAGNPVDQVINEIKHFLNKGDIIIDTGNSFYKDSKRRYEELKNEGLYFIGCGVSGGEEGALKGPSIMPGGDIEAYNSIKNILEDIAAKDFKGGKCVSYIGNNGSGHYVKMVHNGIEYAIMQMIAEGYDLLRKTYNLTAPEIGKIFENFNNGKLNSYLFEISSKILYKKDEFNDNQYLIDNILDSAGAKGTGLWTSIEGLEKGFPIGTIIEATETRSLSGKKELRKKLSRIYNLEKNTKNNNLEEIITDLEKTLFTGMIISYTQGLALINETSKEENWNINMSEITRIWQGGCIIRAKILEFLTDTYNKNNEVENILELTEVKNEIILSLESYKKIINLAVTNNIPMPSLSSGLNYLYGITSEKNSANFIQGLRDYFGAHTYKRLDQEGIFHTKWE